MASFDDSALKAKVAAVSAALERSAQDAEAVVSELDALHVACGAASADARALIRDLTATVNARGVATATSSAGGAGGAAEEIAALERELAAVDAERAALADAGDVGADDAGLAKKRHAASLYANITRVTWAPDCGDGVIAGVVAYDDGHTARRFSIDAAKGEFAVAQELWALLDRPGVGAYPTK